MESRGTTAIPISHDCTTTSISVHRTNVCFCFKIIFLDAATWHEHPVPLWLSQTQFVFPLPLIFWNCRKEKSYKTGLRVDRNLSGRGICREGSLPSREETGRATGLFLPILASVATVTIKGKGDEESHRARPRVPDNWKEEGTVEGFLLDTHAMHRDGILPTDLATFPG